MNGLSNVAGVPAEAPGRSAREFIAEVIPRRRLDELVLPDLTHLAATQLIEEPHRASLLRFRSLEPRHRILLVGPPGNGKTTSAEALAESLAVPFLVMRYEAMIGSFLGETAALPKRVFEYARTTPCVLFFDEFDAVGKERGDIHATGEIKRVVTSLLTQVDDLPSYVVVVTATNHAELLDRAVWLAAVPVAPDAACATQKQLAAFLTSLASRPQIRLGLSAERIAKALGRGSYREAEEIFTDIMRRRVLSNHAGVEPASYLAASPAGVFGCVGALAGCWDRSTWRRRVAPTTTSRPPRAGLGLKSSGARWPTSTNAAARPYSIPGMRRTRAGGTIAARSLPTFWRIY